jgi:hypothetical protein
MHPAMTGAEMPVSRDIVFTSCGFNCSFRSIKTRGRARMEKRCGVLAALAMAAWLLPVEFGLAQSFDGQYTGKLDCAQLPYTKAELDAEPVALTIADGKVSYSRTLYDHDRSEVVGKETGSGAVAPDGSITLSGGWTGRRDSVKASYRGKFAGGAATLSGRHVISYDGKTYNRICSMTIAR